MKRSILLLLAASALLGVAACEENVPTAVDPDLFPISPQSLEIRLPWNTFAEDLQVFGGFGAPSSLGIGVLAQDFGGILDARTLARFSTFPDTIDVQDSEGTSRPSPIEYDGGRIVARFDTLNARPDGPVTVVARTFQGPWHARSATWTEAVDTAGDVQAWPEPGAGPADSVAGGVWDPAEGDSLVLELDSAIVLQFADTTDDARNLRLDMQTPGERVEVEGITLRLDAIPEIRTDTVVTVSRTPLEMTFIYTPFPEPPPDGIRIGGAPSWRTTFGLEIPTTFSDPDPVCSRVQCPFTLDPERISAATLILRSRTTDPAFQPTDTVRLDARPVLAPEELPKSPLGGSFIGPFGRAVPAAAFGAEAGREIAIPLTGFVRDLIEGETSSGLEPPRTLALLSLFEPLSLSYASFAGPGAEGEPYLRLIVTVADSVEIR